MNPTLNPNSSKIPFFICKRSENKVTSIKNQKMHICMIFTDIVLQ